MPQVDTQMATGQQCSRQWVHTDMTDSSRQAAEA